MRGYRFTDLEHLKRWLETTKWGADVMRDVLYGREGERFLAEHIARGTDELTTRPTFSVVELHGDGYVRVYGERHLRATIIQRPMTTIKDSSLAANLIDELMWLNMKPPYREVYWPSYCRAVATLERVTVRQQIERERNAAFELSAIRLLEGVGK